MIKDHLEQLQSRLEEENGLPESTRAELLKLVAAVKQEAGLEEGAAAEAAEAEEQPGINRLMASVEGLEASHPELAASINQVAATLFQNGHLKVLGTGDCDGDFIVCSEKVMKLQRLC